MTVRPSEHSHRKIREEDRMSEAEPRRHFRLTDIARIRASMLGIVVAHSSDSQVRGLQRISRCKFEQYASA